MPYIDTMKTVGSKCTCKLRADQRPANLGPEVGSPVLKEPFPRGSSKRGLVSPAVKESFIHCRGQANTNQRDLGANEAPARESALITCQQPTRTTAIVKAQAETPCPTVPSSHHTLQILSALSSGEGHLEKETGAHTLPDGKGLVEVSPSHGREQKGLQSPFQL